MKYAYAVLLLLSVPVLTSAQKSSFYADAGICLAYLDPGTSATYNYNCNKHIALGAGLQEYSFHTTLTNAHQLTSAVFGEMRYNMRRRKKGQYFSMLDMGIDFYRHNDSYYRDGEKTYTVPGNNGFYTGLAFGYVHYTTRRHGGPYCSLKMISNWYRSNSYDAATNEYGHGGSSDGTLVVSVGFRF